MRAKPVAPIEIVSDVNRVAIALLTTVRDDPQSIIDEVQRGIDKDRWMDAQSECWLAAPHGYLSTSTQQALAEQALVDPHTSPLPMALLGIEAWIATSCGYNGRLTGGKIGDTWYSKKLANVAQRRVLGLTAESHRMRDVEIAERDGMETIARLAGNPHALLFVDPPYMYAEDGGGSRSKRSTYGVGEVDRVWHGNLIDALLAAKCMVVLTTGNDDDYRERLASWDSELVYGSPSGGIKGEKIQTRERRVRHIVWRNEQAIRQREMVLDL